MSFSVDFFFYGTLLDPDVRRIVLGPATKTGPHEPGSIAGVRRAPVVGKTFPMLVRDPAGRVDGMLVPGVDLNAAARISFFESDGYLPERMGVALEAGGQAVAWVYMPIDKVRPAPGAWHFDDWRRRHLTAYLRDSRAWMRGCGGREQERLREDWRLRLRED